MSLINSLCHFSPSLIFFHRNKIILEEQKDHIFTVSYELSSELALTQPGDRVSMDYMEDPTGVCPALSFDNLEFTQKGSGS